MPVDAEFAGLCRFNRAVGAFGVRWPTDLLRPARYYCMPPACGDSTREANVAARWSKQTENLGGDLETNPCNG
jgi:hypothetical protein